MKIESSFREPVRVVMHLNGGYTRVVVTHTEGLGISGGGAEWDIPTDSIPFRLRQVGLKFLLIVPRVRIEPQDTPEEMRRLRDQVEVRELSSSDTEE